MVSGRTLAEKIWDKHAIDHRADAPDLIYVDLHLTHEATSAQAFDGLREQGRGVRRSDQTLAVEDHNVPTDSFLIQDPVSQAQIEALRSNCAEFDIELFRLRDHEQGIAHVVAPELGLVHPGMTVACGDSHTSTHGALGALAFGIGTSEVEHVLATQTIPLPAWRTMRVEFTGSLSNDVGAKDLALALIAQIGVNGARGHVVEYSGPVVSALSIEARMTLCNMTIEAGGRAGLVGPDETTLDYLQGRLYAPSAADWDEAVAYWTQLRTDASATFDRQVSLDVTGLTPYVTWGTNPGQAIPLRANVPDPADLPGAEVSSAIRALDYMNVSSGKSLIGLPVDVVFLGSCTNGRIEDLRLAAEVLRGRSVSPRVTMLVVPGSMRVRAQAEAEGLDKIFLAAGAQWRTAGCSMCIGMNPDRLPPGSRCVSTSNRNFEGRQGIGVRTHLVSPGVAAATAVAGGLAAPADL